MSECNSSVMRIAFLDQNVAIEAAHFMDCKDSDAAKGFRSNRKHFSFCDVAAKDAFAIALLTVESDL